jgi:hypothetical protein
MLKISLGRRLLSVILTTMLPTAIIVIVALSTNYYNTDHHFKTIIPVNLTCLLMMVTMSIGVSASLPKTGFSSTLTILFTFQVTKRAWVSCSCFLLKKNQNVSENTNLDTRQLN